MKNVFAGMSLIFVGIFCILLYLNYKELDMPVGLVRIGENLWCAGIIGLITQSLFLRKYRSRSWYQQLRTLYLLCTLSAVAFIVPLLPQLLIVALACSLIAIGKSHSLLWNGIPIGISALSTFLTEYVFLFGGIRSIQHYAFGDPFHLSVLQLALSIVFAYIALELRHREPVPPKPFY